MAVDLGKGVLLTILSMLGVAALIVMRLRSGTVSPNALLLVEAYRMIGGEPPEQRPFEKQDGRNKKKFR